MFRYRNPRICLGLGQVFQEFEQTKSGREVKGGTGLGMSITKAYVNLMGGTIDMESEKGKGTRFRMTLPVRGETAVKGTTTAGPRQVQSLQEDQAGRYWILVVDNVEEHRHWLCQLLESVTFPPEGFIRF